MVGRRRFFQGLGAAGTLALVVRVSQREDLTIRHLPASIGGHRVQGAVTHLGAVVILMHDPQGTPYQIDVLAKSTTRGVRDTARYSLFLANRGNGQSPTDEGRGVALMGLADWLDQQDPPLPELATFEARAEAHPNGAFRVC